MASIDRVKVTVPTFDSSKSPKEFRKWMKVVSGLVRSCKGGNELEDYLEEKLGRTLKAKPVVPQFLLSDPDFAFADTARHSPSARREIFMPMSPGIGVRQDEANVLEGEEDGREGGARHPLSTSRSSTRVQLEGSSGRDQAYYRATKRYESLSKEAKELDAHMYSVMVMQISGPFADLLEHVTFSSYVQAVIVLEHHHNISRNSRKSEALDSLDKLKLSGSVQQWTIDVLKAYKEMKECKVTIEDLFLFSLIKSLNGKSKYVQHQIVKDIDNQTENSQIQIYDMVNKYAAEIASVDGAVPKVNVVDESASEDVNQDMSQVNSIKDVVCNKCKQKGHFARECPQNKTEQPGDFRFACGRCGVKGHRRKDCPQKPTGSDGGGKGKGKGKEANASGDGEKNSDSMTNTDLIKMLEKLKSGNATTSSVAEMSRSELEQLMNDTGITEINYDTQPTSVVTVIDMDSVTKGLSSINESSVPLVPNRRVPMMGGDTRYTPLQNNLSTVGDVKSKIVPILENVELHSQQIANDPSLIYDNELLYGCKLPMMAVGDSTDNGSVPSDSPPPSLYDPDDSDTDDEPITQPYVSGYGWKQLLITDYFSQRQYGFQSHNNVSDSDDSGEDGSHHGSYNGSLSDPGLLEDNSDEEEELSREGGGTGTGGEPVCTYFSTMMSVAIIMGKSSFVDIKNLGKLLLQDMLGVGQAIVSRVETIPISKVLETAKLLIKTPLMDNVTTWCVGKDLMKVVKQMTNDNTMVCGNHPMFGHVAVKCGPNLMSKEQVVSILKRLKIPKDQEQWFTCCRCQDLFCDKTIDGLCEQCEYANTTPYITVPDIYIEDRNDLELWILSKNGICGYNNGFCTVGWYDADEPAYSVNARMDEKWNESPTQAKHKGVVGKLAFAVSVAAEFNKQLIENGLDWEPQDDTSVTALTRLQAKNHDNFEKLQNVAPPSLAVLPKAPASVDGELVVLEDGVWVDLCSGISCLAMVAKRLRIKPSKYFAVENSADAKKVAKTVHGPNSDFPNIDYSWKSDLLSITEQDVIAFGKVNMVGMGAPCQDHTRLRLLKPRFGNNPSSRPGFAGPKGKVFKHGIQVIKWMINQNPKLIFMVENVDFSDMTEDYNWVCSELGVAPILLDGSRTRRHRLYWTNLKVPDDIANSMPAYSPDECMDEGRSLVKHGKEQYIRTICASWSGDPDCPEANTRLPIYVDDENCEELQQLRAHEAEKLMGMPANCTQGEGITNLMRLTCIGNGWDVDIVSMLMCPYRVHLETLPSAKNALTRTDMLLQKSLVIMHSQLGDKDFAVVLEQYGRQQQLKMMELLALWHKENTVAMVNNVGSILDSGSG
ncbi:MAG: hypothetical protein CBB72_005020, partial [Muricauda sp. TMED12]